jgi:hypothetical protein
VECREDTWGMERSSDDQYTKEKKDKGVRFIEQFGIFSVRINVNNKIERATYSRSQTTGKTVCIP